MKVIVDISKSSKGGYNIKCKAEDYLVLEDGVIDIALYRELANRAAETVNHFAESLNDNKKQ